MPKNEDRIRKNEVDEDDEEWYIVVHYFACLEESFIHELTNLRWSCIKKWPKYYCYEDLRGKSHLEKHGMPFPSLPYTILILSIHKVLWRKLCRIQPEHGGDERQPVAPLSQ